MLTHEYDISDRLLRKVWVDRLVINRVRAVLIKQVPIINILKVDVVNYKPGGVLILFNGDGLLSLSQQLELGNLIDINILVPILLCL